MLKGKIEISIDARTRPKENTKQPPCQSPGRVGGIDRFEGYLEVTGSLTETFVPRFLRLLNVMLP
jgi:hypothetical protein